MKKRWEDLSWKIKSYGKIKNKTWHKISESRRKRTEDWDNLQIEDKMIVQVCLVIIKL